MNVSYLRSYTDTMPTVTTLDTLVRTIRGEGDDGARVAALTETYRQTGSKAVSMLRSGFQFWFSREEIQELSCHNRQFETPCLEQELVMLYFRKPEEREHGLFMPTARIMQHIGTNITQKLSAVWVGRALVEMGFPKVTVRHVRGFIVVPRTGDEIMQYQKSLALPHNHE